MIYTKRGKELTKEEVDFMIQNRVSEYGENTKDFENKEQDSLFFFFIKNSHIKAFGMLKPIDIRFEGKDYKIMGIGNVMSVTKGQGYGRILINNILDYLNENKLTGIGFAEDAVVGFYRSCGLCTNEKIATRFRYIYQANPSNTEHEARERLTDGDNMIYVSGTDGLIERIMRKEGDIEVKQPFW